MSSKYPHAEYSVRAAPQTALEFEGKIFHMAQTPEHYHQMVEKCVKGGAAIFLLLGKGSSEHNEVMESYWKDQ